MSPLDELDGDIIYKYNKQCFEKLRSVPVEDEDSRRLFEDEDEYLSKPSKIQEGSLRHYSEFECGMGKGGRASLSRKRFSL